MISKILIVDYGMGNLNSIGKAMQRLKVDYIISSNPADISSAEKIILPGIGHFGRAMSNLKQLQLIEPLHKAVLAEKKKILGICLGMQLLAKTSEEGNALGLGWIDAEIVRFRVSDKLKFKVPQMGWNQIKIRKDSLLMKNISDNSEFYFAHSYYTKLNDESVSLNETFFESDFVSAVEKDNIFGVQYHPEKSHETGLQLLKNFVEL